MTDTNPLGPALKAVRLAWLEVAAVYEPNNTPLEESWAIRRAYEAVQAAHAHLAVLRHKRGMDDGMDLTNLVAFDRAKAKSKPKRRKNKRAVQ